MNRLIAFTLVIVFLLLFPLQANDMPVSFSYPIQKKEYGRVVAGYEEIRESLKSEKQTFIEVNFSDMEIRTWKEGILQHKTVISAVGDPQEWGGTPAGLYEVQTKYKSVLSGVAQVYMPWAVGFYGKYFLHGIPYYPGGDRRITDVTGGCVQSTDEDAKIIYDFAQIGMPILVIDREQKPPLVKQDISLFPSVSAPSYMVVDMESGTVLAEKDSNLKVPIASLTKLITGSVIVENVDLRKSVPVSSSMLTRGFGSTVGLEAGKYFGVIELLYPFFIESSNDAAEALTYFFGRLGTIRMMNEK